MNYRFVPKVASNYSTTSDCFGATEAIRKQSEGTHARLHNIEIPQITRHPCKIRAQCAACGRE